jgi:hypothetical protein
MSGNQFSQLFNWFSHTAQQQQPVFPTPQREWREVAFSWLASLDHVPSHMRGIIVPAKPNTP